MKTISRRTWILTALMGAAAGGAYVMRPRLLLADELGPIALDKNIPKQIGAWREDVGGAAAIVNPETQQLLDSLYTELLSRTYVGPDGHRIMLSIAYGRNQADDKAVHYPDVCYPAQGFKISNKQKALLQVAGKTIGANQMVATMGRRNEPITYWATVGQYVIPGPAQHKLKQLEYGFSGKVPDGLIFRISSIGDAASEEYKIQSDFIQHLAENIPKATQIRLFGA
jgi:EpsI family protein